MRIEKMATSRAYLDYIKECNILHKARTRAARRALGPHCTWMPSLRRALGGCARAFLSAQMSHPNVLCFVGVCCEPPNLCIVAEFLSGGSVYDLLHTSRRLPAGHAAGQLRLSAPLALRLAADVAAGMTYLHSQGIIHRDLKSANLLLDSEDRVKGAWQLPHSQRPGHSVGASHHRPRPPQWRTLGLRAACRPQGR